MRSRAADLVADASSQLLMGLYFLIPIKRCIMDLEAIGFGDCLGKHYDIFG
jgi:hypothetical protein